MATTVTACTAADQADPEQPSALGTAGATSSEVVEPASESSPPATPQQAALSAYEEYMAATVEALSSGEADGGPLSAVADDQALAHARRRLRANRRDDVLVTGMLTSSATAADVQFDGVTTARLRDCVLNGLEQVAADDRDRVVTAATGWRQPVEATVENRDGDWVVTRIKVPLRDGSGTVPPPPDEPPYLRGPAQGPAPPSCVPENLARQAVAAYEAFVDAYEAALGYGGIGPVNPNASEIAATMVDPQLSTLRDFVADLRADGEAFRGQRDDHDPWAVSTTSDDELVIVYDCVKVGEYARVDQDVRDPSETNDDAGSRRLDGADVVRTNDVWKVAGVSVIEEGLQECTAAGQ